MDIVQIPFRCSPELHKKFKILCTVKNRKMQQELNEIVGAYIDENWRDEYSKINKLVK